MKILLTGHNGFLGNKIKDKLSKFTEIKTLGRNNSDFNYDLKNRDLNFKENFEIIIHCAGKAHSIPKSKFEIQDFYNINVNGTKNLLENLNIKPPKHFVFISSVAVYGTVNGNNLNENSPFEAKDPYGISKIQAEKIIQDWCDKHDVLCTILRLPLVVGENPPGNLGAMIRGIKKGYYFNIKGGHSRKSMVLADDVAKFILKAAEVGGIYNLTDGYHPSFYEISHLIANQLGKSYIPNMPNFIAKFLAKIGDLIGPKFPINTDKYLKITSDLTFDDSKAREAFGWDPTPVLKGFKIK